MEIASDIFGNIQSFYILVTIVTVIIVSLYHLFVYLAQKRDRQADFFKKCSVDLYADNETARITAAILLRGFLKKKDYRQDTLNLIVALLRILPAGNLQKTLADGLSFLRRADGHDFQHINLRNASIKPHSRIRFEISGDNRFRGQRISMVCADFYQSDPSNCSICNIDASKAILFDCTLKKTAFHDCLLRGADFSRADLEHVRFDNCDLEGARFDGARHLSSVCIVAADGSRSGLLPHLDASGVFSRTRRNPADAGYRELSVEKRIFISKPGVMDSLQQACYNNSLDYLRRKYDIIPVVIDRKDYKPTGQLRLIRETLASCSGVVTFAFPHLHVTDGMLNRHVQGDDACRISEQEFASPWLQIETALASCMELPCLIISDKSLCRNGMFDPSVTDDGRLFRIQYSEAISDKKAIFEQWISQVEHHATRHA